jgi:YVTN family beta-propeller protein
MMWLQPFLLLGAALVCQAQVQAPALPGTGAATSSRDRVYTGDQSSNTITVVDPGTNTVLGTIYIGDSRLTDDLNPQYVRAANSHGLGFSRDGKYIVSLSTLTNTVNVIRTVDNTIVSQTHCNRAPHEAFFAADNRTVWVGTRGVSSIDLIDGIAGGVIARIPTADGPSKVLFSPNGTVAYVNHIRASVVSVINVGSRTVMYNITGLADTFSSDMMLSADGGSLWAAHKMTGQVSVIDLAARKVISVLNTGAETNHPQFAYPNGITHAFVTVAALNETKVYLQPSPHEPPTYLTSIRSTGIEPHGLWPNPANTRLYIANEHSDTVDIVNLHTLKVIDTLEIGQETQAVIYVSDAVPEGGGRQNLGTQGLIKEPRPVNAIVSVTGPNTPANGSALITVRPVSGVDEFQVIGRNIHFNSTYTVSARCLQCLPYVRIPLVSFTAAKTPMGCGGAPQVLSFFKWFGVYDLESIEIQEDDGRDHHHQEGWH